MQRGRSEGKEGGGQSKGKERERGEGGRRDEEMSCWRDAGGQAAYRRSCGGAEQGAGTRGSKARLDEGGRENRMH